MQHRGEPRERTERRGHIRRVGVLLTPRHLLQPPRSGVRQHAVEQRLLGAASDQARTERGQDVMVDARTREIEAQGILLIQLTANRPGASTGCPCLHNALVEAAQATQCALLAPATSDFAIGSGNAINQRIIEVSRPV